MEDAATIDWSTLLAHLLARGGPTSQFQPIVDLKRGIVVGYEALCRFDGYQVVESEAWFAAARRLGRAPELEAAALASALRSRRTLPANTFLTVNLSPDLLSSPLVRSVLEAEDTLAGIVVEVTEHIRVESFLGLDPAIEWLRARGAMIAMDDAGAGYAGLRHLLGLRPDIIKVDRSLVSGIDKDEAKRALIEMVGLLGNRLDAWLLAEGVETLGEVEALAQMGVPLAQGYALARPAATWGSLDMDTSVRLITMSSQSSGQALRPLLEQTVTCGSEEEAARLCRDGVEYIVVTGPDARPLATYDGRGLPRSVRDDLRVNIDTEIGEAALRAIARSPGHRFQPLVCIDNAGRYVGIVRIERMIEALARSEPPD